MNQHNTDKEQLLMIFSEMNVQLAELETILRKSFSDLHKDLIREEEDQMAFTEKRISKLEKSCVKREDVMDNEIINYPLGKKPSTGLKLELGF